MRRFVVGAAVVVLLAVTAGCGGASPGSGRTVDGYDQVKVGVVPIVDVAPLYLGQRKGFFSRKKILLEMETGQGGAAIVSDVADGRLQFGFSNLTSLLVAQSKGVPVKVVANGAASTGKAGADYSGVAVRGNSPIRKASDLVGKRVAVNTLKNIGDTTVRESVRKAGGDPSRITFVAMPFADMPAAVAAGKVDAAWVVEPSLSTIRAAGGRVVSWNYVEAAPNLTVAVYFTSAKLLADNPDLVTRFTDGINKSLDHAQFNPAESRAALATYTSIDPDVRAELTLPTWSSEINRASVDTLVRLGTQDGIFTVAPDPVKLLP